MPVDEMAYSADLVHTNQVPSRSTVTHLMLPPSELRSSVVTLAPLPAMRERFAARSLIALSKSDS